MVGQVIIAAPLSMRVERPRFVGQPSGGFTHGSAARGATCGSARGARGRLGCCGIGGGVMVMDGGHRVRGGGGGASALARVPTAA